MIPTGISTGAMRVRAPVSAATRKAAPPSAHAGSRMPVIGSPDEARRVRHHQPDEADEAAPRDGRRGDERRHEDRDALDPVDVDAERARFFLAQAHEVHPSGEEVEDGEAGREATASAASVGHGGGSMFPTSQKNTCWKRV